MVQDSDFSNNIAFLNKIYETTDPHQYHISFIGLFSILIVYIILNNGNILNTVLNKQILNQLYTDKPYFRFDITYIEKKKQHTTSMTIV